MISQVDESHFKLVKVREIQVDVLDIELLTF